MGVLYPKSILRPAGAQERNLRAITVKVVRRLKVERQIAKLRMVDYAHERLKADLALSDTGVPILMGLLDVEGVIQVDRLALIL